jgi:hypothetical protein
MKPEPTKHKDAALEAKHMFGDVGPPIEQADYRPRIYGNPETILAAAFIKMKRDYGGPLPADFVLHAVLQSAG